MAANLKSPKDKPKSVRVAPRPTAASAARAAMNAKNRNLTSQPVLKESSSHIRPALSPHRKLSPPVSNPTVVATKSEINRQPESKKLEESHVPVHQTPDRFVIPDNTLNPMDPLENADSVVTAVEYFRQGESEVENNDNIDIENTEDSLHPDETREMNDCVQPDETDTVQNEEPDQAQNDEAATNMVEVDNEPGVRTPLPQSRPMTPKISSRPITPKSRPHTPSRPTTPAPPTSRISSRPTTPSTAVRPTTPRRVSPGSRPTTPQIPPASYGSRSLTSSIPVATAVVRNQPPTPIATCPPVKEEEDIKTVFATKQMQFQRMKKELDIKQQAVLDLFDNLRNLNERLVKEGSGEGVQLQEMVVFNVGDWTSEEITQLCRDTAASNNENAIDFIDNLKHIDEGTLAALDAQVSSVPSKFAELCLQAFTARQELIDWVKELIEPMQEDGRGESLERIAHYNNQGLELYETLRELKARADDAVDTVTQISRCALRERSTLLSVGESLVREIARLRQDLEARAVIVNEMREIRAENDTAKDLQEARNQLEEERTARVAAKDKLATAESQLRQTRVRVTKMDRQLREAEATIVSLTASVKALEDQSRQKEVHLEARARKLKESLKTGEVAHSHIIQQRDALQAEVKNLKEQLETLIATNKTNLQEYNKEIKELKASLENQRQETEKQIEQNQELEKNLAESIVMIDSLKAKIPDPNDNNPELPTEKEIDLWAELQATKEMLHMTEDEVTACKREKVRFLETLTKISESENKIGMQQKLAAELLSKEEIIGKMQIQIRELTKNIKLNEQKVAQYEQYVRDLQAHLRTASGNNDNANQLSYQDWQQEIMSLKMNLLDTVHMNEKLTEVLAQKEQQLEQQDKTSRAQVNKQIAAKAEEIQELFATLENKQQQIHRLEKIVLALEEQQRRAQAQRMRHEEKIAALEHELAATNRRERKFLFF